MKHTNIKGRLGDWNEAQKQAMVAMEEQFQFAEEALRQGEEGLEDEGKTLVVKGPKNAKVAAAKAKVDRIKSEMKARAESTPIKEAGGVGNENAIAFLRTGGMTSDEMSRVNRYIATLSEPQKAKINKAIFKAEAEKDLELLYKRILLIALQKGF